MMTNLYIGLLCLISLTKAKALSETTLILTSSNFTALKPGLRSASSNSTSCEQECTSNADCIGDWICCTRLCGPSFHLAPPEEPLATTTPILIVTPPQYDGEPAYIQLPEDPVVRAEEGNYVTMSCNATGNSRPTVSWRKDAKQIDSTISRHRILNDGALQIVGLYRSDAGIYTCTANNSLGTAARVEYQLDVTDPHVRSSSIIGEEKNEVTVAMNSPAQLNCYAIGWPRPSVTWWHEDAMVPLTSDVYEQRQDHSLLIRSVTLSSLGVYTCLTFNGIQRPSLWSVTLQAHGPVHDVNPEHQKYMNYLVYLPTTTDPTHEDQTDIFTETYRGPLNVNVSAPRNRVPEGSEVTITCDVDKYFIKGIQWYKDGNIIRTEHRMQITTKELVIPNAKREDSGTYLCVAYESLHNRIGSGAVTIKVLVPVKLNVSVPQTKFPEGSKVSITCNVDGFWTPGMRWYKDDNVIQPNERMQIIAYGLIISDAKRKDTGTYRCEAYDSMSDKIGSGTVTIKVLVPVKLNVSVPQNKFPESSEISITCNVDGFLTPEILWYKNDNVIQANEKTQIIANGLIISEAKRRDSGTYRCEAYDSMSDKIGSGAVTIKVLVPVKLNVSVLQNKILEGNEVSITCNVDGFLTPEIRWYKGDKVIQPNERMQIIAYGLIIPDAKRRDSGTYRCEAYDSMCDKIGSGAVTIEVLVPVKLNVSVPQSKFPYGGDISIACVVDGYPIPRILWYKDENLIQTDNRVLISEVNELIISRANSDDSGTYRCEATNQFSTRSGSVEIEVSVDECLLPGRCSHFCDNEKGSIKCSCATGYLRDPQDLTRCKAAEGHASLLVGVSGNIFNITLDGQEMTAIANNTNYVLAFDFDFRTGMIFWGDFTEKKIYKAPIDEGNHRTMIIDRVHNDINSLAVDWIYNHIYWIDNVKSTIDLANFEGNMRKTLITERLNWPLAIALNPLEGWMFWTDWGGWWDNPRIERAGMDGSHRSIIVETEVREPYGLTLDSIGRRLYWVDYELKTIASCNYDGSERRTILNSPDTLRGPWSITTFEDHVYWMNYHTNDIFRANKFTGKDVERVTSSFSQYAYVLHVYHPYTQPDGKNQCQEGNGNCTHLCLPAPIISSKSPLLSCACPDGLKLMPDGLTCSENGH